MLTILDIVNSLPVVSLRGSSFGGGFGLAGVHSDDIKIYLRCNKRYSIIKGLKNQMNLPSVVLQIYRNNKLMVYVLRCRSEQ